MKKIIAMVCFVLACITIVFIVGVAIYGVWEVNNIRVELMNTGASGMEFLSVPVVTAFFGIVIFVAAVFGLIFSLISQKMQENKVLKNLSVGGSILFTLVFYVLLVCVGMPFGVS